MALCFFRPTVSFRSFSVSLGGGEGLPPADGDRIAGIAHGSAPGGCSAQCRGEHRHLGQHRPIGSPRCLAGDGGDSGDVGGDLWLIFCKIGLHR